MSLRNRVTKLEQTIGRRCFHESLTRFRATGELPENAAQARLVRGWEEFIVTISGALIEPPPSPESVA